MKTLPLRSERGSLLIVSMVLCAIIGISLASYLQLSRTALTISNRALYSNAAMNLAENGLEEAMYALNKRVADSSYSFPGWTQVTSTNDVRDIWTGYTFDQNATGVLRVYIDDALSGNSPVATARATITLGGSSARTIEKWVQVRLKKTSKFSNGLVAKNSITFNGNNVTVDSWDSTDNSTGAIIPYSSSVRNDNGSVGSISVSNGAVATNNGDVWGWVSTGGDDPTDNVGTQGSILGETSASGLKVDPARVATDFSATFDAVEAQSTTPYTAISPTTISDDLTLPINAATDSWAMVDGVKTYYYSASKIDFNNKEFKIANGYNVVLKLTNTSTAIKMAGNDSVITVGTGSSLSIYGEGDVTFAGKGLANGADGTDANTTVDDNEINQPIKFQFWGTKTSGTQNIDVHGNGTFSGVIYAPQGAVTITGNGSVSGSVVANTIKLTGNAAFHYDESLGDFGGDNPFRIQSWSELTTESERTTAATKLSFTN